MIMDYAKLNYYLNEICNYLNDNYPFLLENIRRISILNDEFLKTVNNYSLDNVVIKNNLTFMEVLSLSREVIANIDKNYLEEFDSLLASGELDFGYENEYIDSECQTIFKNNEVNQIINIDRKFNYDDVRCLVHEFIHYTNTKKRTINIDNLTEFLAIYFEFYTIAYLLKKGINKEELDYLKRIKGTKRHASIFFQYEIVLLAYVTFGRINDNSINLLKKYLLNIKESQFEKECMSLYKNISLAEDKFKKEIESNPELFGKLVSNEFIVNNYKYILGTILALYAYKNVSLEKMVYLNNHLSDYDDLSIKDILLSIGIDFNSGDFLDKFLESLEDFLQFYENDYQKNM